MGELSILRLNLLRFFYAVLLVGLGVFVWPDVFHHPGSAVGTIGVRTSLLAGLGASAALGLRYPLQMLPLLLFELLWKAIYLLGFALPLYLSHGIDSDTAKDINACLMVVVFIPLIPWRYVVVSYLLKPGSPWFGVGKSKAIPQGLKSE